MQLDQFNTPQVLLSAVTEGLADVCVLPDYKAEPESICNISNWTHILDQSQVMSSVTIFSMKIIQHNST